MWRDLLYRTANFTENQVDELKLRFRQRMGWDTVVHICPYVSFGNQSSLYIKGRVLHDRGIAAGKEDEFWDNLLNMYGRLNSHEIKGAKLRASYYNNQVEFFSDDDGYFGIELAMPKEISGAAGWHYPTLELLDAPIPFKAPLTAQAKVLVPAATAAYGIISDIDDTILKTNATSLIRMAWNTFAHNAHTRKPFPGVAAFYAALQKGVDQETINPIFYISSSPWNLYDLLTDFMELNHIPEGPLFLKDYGFTENKLFTAGHSGHKMKKLRKVLNAYPAMKFILIGDSGQEDPEIYSELIKEYPERILAVYLRDVTLDERDMEVRHLYTAHKVDMVYSENSLVAAEHAASKGFIPEATLEAIRSEKEMDRRREE